MIPEQLWSRVYAGMYNGALVIPLNTDMPDAMAPNPVLEELEDRVRKLVNELSVLISDAHIRYSFRLSLVLRLVPEDSLS